MGIKNQSLIHSLNKCRKAFNEEIYEIWYSEIIFRELLLKPMNLKYIAFEHKPGMKFNQHLVNIGGFLGLWHGLSLLDLKSLFIRLKKILFSYKYTIISCHK
jgi:hypothetical protein